MDTGVNVELGRSIAATLVCLVYTEGHAATCCTTLDSVSLLPRITFRHHQRRNGRWETRTEGGGDDHKSYPNVKNPIYFHPLGDM